MNTLLTLFFSVIVYHFSSAQIYEKIYAESSIEVQNKINQNKVNGVDILTGVWSHHSIVLIGLSSAQNNKLNTTLSKIKEVKFININDENNLLSIVTEPKFTKESLKEVLDQFNVVISGYFL